MERAQNTDGRTKKMRGETEATNQSSAILLAGVP